MAGRVSQCMAEAVSAISAADVDARVSQCMAEVQAAVPIADVEARVSQIMGEVVHSLDVFVPVPPAGGTGRWFKELWPDMWAT